MKTTIVMLFLFGACNRDVPRPPTVLPPLATINQSDMAPGPASGMDGGVTTCGASAQPCCDGTCNENLFCIDGTCGVPNCGGEGQECCTVKQPCGPGLTCFFTANVCVIAPECGNLGESCCKGNTCTVGQCAPDGTCELPPPCGGIGQECCQSGASCVSGTCDTSNVCTCVPLTQSCVNDADCCSGDCDGMPGNKVCRPND